MGGGKINITIGTSVAFSPLLVCRRPFRALFLLLFQGLKPLAIYFSPSGALSFLRMNLQPLALLAMILPPLLGDSFAENSLTVHCSLFTDLCSLNAQGKS
jgi:hypothetical protein